MRFLAILGMVLLCLTPARAQQAPVSEPPMTIERMVRIFTAIDPQLQLIGPRVQLSVNDTPVLVIADPLADRMRAMVRIGPAEALDAALAKRLLQANFDAVLDARYAIAQGQVWSVFIHPLSPLETRELVSGLAQVVNAAQSFGIAFSGGGVQFGGGDSNALHQELLEQLQKKGLPL